MGAGKWPLSLQLERNIYIWSGPIFYICRGFRFRDFELGRNSFDGRNLSSPYLNDIRYAGTERCVMHDVCRMTRSKVKVKVTSENLQSRGVDRQSRVGLIFNIYTGGFPYVSYWCEDDDVGEWCPVTYYAISSRDDLVWSWQGATWWHDMIVMTRRNK